MTTKHYLVFVGASPSLSDELRLLRSRVTGSVRIIAAGVKSNQRGLSNHSISRALDDLVSELERDGQPDSVARLSVWAYEPTDPLLFPPLWRVFGRSGWLELIPSTYMNKDRPTRLYIESRVALVEACLHEISHEVTARRRTSPVPIPFTNFKSRALGLFQTHWYGRLNSVQFKDTLRTTNDRFRQAHTQRGPVHFDDRNLIFAPAPAEACHGMPHPVGTENSCYVGGRFRFGAALFAGHHYDVRQRHGTLACTLYDCVGQPRELTSEKRHYINVFPNEHLLPELHQ